MTTRRVLKATALLLLAYTLTFAFGAWFGHAIAAEPFPTGQSSRWVREVAPASPLDADKPAKPADDAITWAARGEQTCIKCHDTVKDRTVLHTAHGVKDDPTSPMANHACESCHGPSDEHNNARPPKGEKRPPVDVSFKEPLASPVDKRNEVCRSCHLGEEHINWPGSKHQQADVACTDCHTLHTTQDPVMDKMTQPEVCFSCHAQQRGEAQAFSHHPIKEGKVSCSDCHAVHGSGGPSLLTEMTTNETCYTCHAEQRGPFIWEHEPVRDDCMTCHTPHGSTQKHLLTMRDPFLCMTCHQTSRNSHDALLSGGNQLPGGSGVGSYNMLLSSGCSNCHSKVHGSSAPSGGMLTH